MVYVTGDTHGDKSYFQTPQMKKLKKDDTVIICGDFGFVWDGDKSEQKVLKWLSERKYKIAFVEGTHENFDLLKSYPETEIWGAKARHLGGNIYMLLKGEIYTIEGKTFLAFGGGVVDESSDLLDSTEVFLGSHTTSQEVANAKANLDKYDWKVDYIITHDTTTKVKSFIMIEQDHSYLLNTFLDELYTNCKYKRWFFGCYHMDKIITPQVTGVFAKVIALDK